MDSCPFQSFSLKSKYTIIKTVDFFEFCLILNRVVYSTVLEVHTSKIEQFIQSENCMWLKSELEYIWMREVYVNLMQVAINLCVLNTDEQIYLLTACWIQSLFCLGSSSSKQKCCLATYSSHFIYFAPPCSVFRPSYRTRRNHVY